MNFGIIAAGEGSRLAQEGVSYPKPLVPLQGEPMIGRLIRIFTGCGADRIAIIVNEQMTEVQRYVEELQDRSAVKIDLVIKSTPSSMHSFYELGRLLKGHGRFVVTTVDTIFREADFREYIDAYEAASNSVDGMMAVTSFVDDEKPLYVEADAKMNIKAFRDTPEDNTAEGDKEFISGGIYGLGDKAVEVLDGCLKSGMSRMRNYQRALVENGLLLKAFDMGKILDVDHADDIRKAEEYISAC
ncbi:MAG: NTP transferase domain-containing protein [Muribaculaceae bacterium]|nr:NTP transferase domain-containing protein [Muribaculaceae bacterium]